VDGDLSKDFRENYDILYGEFMSGNDNKEIKAKLKQYILYGYENWKIKKKWGNGFIDSNVIKNIFVISII